MKKYLWAIVLGAVLFITTGCPGDTNPPGGNDPKSQFGTKTEYGIYVAGEALQNSLVFNKASHQLYFGDAANCSRILSNDATQYVELKLDADASAGQTVEGEITVTGLQAGLVSQGLSAEVIKLADGKCWLWCTGTSNTFGAIVMWIE